MNYANLFFDDTVNGTGFRTSIFLSGCKMNPPCYNCWSPQARDFQYGKPYTKETTNQIINSLKKEYVRGLSILGGEPTDNLEDGQLLDLVKTIKKQFPNKTIFCWTGRTLENIVNEPLILEFLKYIDMLRDGRYIEELRDIKQYLGGSQNQRYVDVQEYLRSGRITNYKF